MSAISLDVFALRDSVVDEYKKFSTSFTKIHAEDTLAAAVRELAMRSCRRSRRDV